MEERVSLKSTQNDNFDIDDYPSPQTKKINKIFHLGIIFVIIIICCFLTLFVISKSDHIISDPQNSSHQNSFTEDHIKEQKYKRLVEWLLKSGARIEGVEGKSMFAGGGRGLYATKNLTEQENAFSIPSSLWISDRNALRRSIVLYLSDDEFVKSYLDKPGDSWGLILMLEYEQYNPFSFWKPYTDFIPKPASAIGWSDAEINEMQSDILRINVKENQKYIETTYNELMVYLIEKYPHFYNSENNTYESFLASTLTCWSRTFETTPSSGLPMERGLVPLGDLLNHHAGIPQTHWQMTLDTTNKCDTHDPLTFEFYAPQSKNAGEQILVSYSDTRATSDWVQWAGFVPLESNYGDFITLTISENNNTNENINKTAEEILNQMPVNKTTWVGIDGLIPEPFIEEYITSRYQITPAEISQGLLIEALGELADYLRNFEKNLNTTLEQDLLELDNQDKNKLGFKRFQALTFRSRFKKIIRKIIDNLRIRAKRSDPKIENLFDLKDENSIVYNFDDNEWSFSSKIGYSLVIISINQI